MTYLAMITLEMQQQTTSQTTQPHFWVAEWLQWTSPGACSQQATDLRQRLVWFYCCLVLPFIPKSSKYFCDQPEGILVMCMYVDVCPNLKDQPKSWSKKKAANCQCAHFFLSQEVNQVNSRICGHLVGTPKKSDKTFSRSCCGDQDSSP